MRFLRFAFSGSIAVLAACSGGGASSSPVPQVSAAGIQSMPTSIPASLFVASGSVKEFTSKAALAGATVTLGSFPGNACVGWLGCGSPLPPTYSAVSDSTGAFSVAKLPGGTYFATIALDPNPITGQAYAVLHRGITVQADVALGNISVAKLSADESGWISKLNTERSGISYPATPPIVIDEFSQEQARAEATAVADGSYPYGDATEGVFIARYANTPNVIPAGVGGVADLNDSYAHAEDAYFAEKANCPSGDWRSCAFGGITGHYINLSRDNASWVGLGESATVTGLNTPYPGFHAFAGIIPLAGVTARAASTGRIARALAPHRN